MRRGLDDVNNDNDVSLSKKKKISNPPEHLGEACSLLASFEVCEKMTPFF